METQEPSEIKTTLQKINLAIAKYPAANKKQLAAAVGITVGHLTRLTRDNNVPISNLQTGGARTDAGRKPMESANKSRRYSTYIDTSMWARIEKFKITKRDRWKYELSWKAPTVRMLIEKALNSERLLTETDAPAESGGVCYEIRIEPGLSEKIEAVRTPRQSNYALIKKLIDIGLKELEGF